MSNRFALRLAALTLVVSGLAFGATYEGTQVTKVLERTGKDLNGAAKQSFVLTSEIFRVTSELKMVPETVWQCEGDIPADGTRGDWKGLYNAPKAEKPSRLADAVKGVGLTTARRLIDDGYFDNKPRSWAEFRKRIEDADAEYKSGFSYGVLVTYKKENMINLGYLVEGQCSFKTELVLRRVPVKTFARHENRQYEVRVSGGPLITGEKESFTVSFDGFEDSLTVNSAFNEYRVERLDDGRVTVFDVIGVNRKQVRPANNLNVTASVAGGQLQLQVSDPSFDADLNEDRFIVVKAQIDKRGWKKNQDLGSFERPLAKNGGVTNLTDLNLAVPAGADLVMYYELRVAGSRYHSGELSPTKKLKLKLN